MNSPPSVSVTHGPDNEKTSPLTFLPGLKSYNIVHTKYKHYGHLSGSDQLEKIMSPEEKNHKHDSRSSLVSLHPITSPLDTPNRESLVGNIEGGEKPQDDDTVREMLRLKIEQERTKQAHHKTELARLVLELLREAETHGFGGDLIRKLFLDDAADHYRAYMHYLHGNMSSGIKRKHSGSDGDGVGPAGHPMASTGCMVATSEENGTTNEVRVSTPPTTVARTPSPGKLPELDPGSDTALQIHNSPAVPPSRTLSGSQPHSINLRPPASLTGITGGGAPTSSGATSAARLPNMPVYLLHLYPVYYTQVPDQMQANPGKPGSLHEEGELGLPYASQKYPTVIFHSLPQQVPGQGVPLLQQNLQQGLQQSQPRPYYYVNSLPPTMQGPVMTSQYFIPPPIPGMMQWGAAPVPEKKPEEEHHPKRLRGTKNSINFMITTPKNPPAKKYNKL